MLNIRALNSSSNFPNSDNTNDQDEYNTIFTKTLPLSMTTPNFDEDSEIDHCNQSICSLNDFIGGPIENTEECSFASGEHCVDFNRSITATPADSSCGFHNTFCVLENHLKNKKRCLKLSQQQIEYLLLQNKDLAIHDDSYIDIPINDNHSLRTVNGLVNSSMNDINGWDVSDEEISSHFELEFETMERLRSMWGDKASPNIQIANIEENESSTSLAESNLLEDFYQEDDCSIGTQNSNKYIYHVAKRNGQLYIRVRRNFRSDQGN